MPLAFGLAALGLLLIYVEFFLPGGIFAVFGAILLIASFILFATQETSSFLIAGYFLLLCVLLYFTIRYALHQIRKSGSKESFFLRKDQAGAKASTFDPAFTGKQATAFSDLKPSGHILVDGQILQAVSEAGYIPKDTAVKITGGEGAHYKVIRS